MRDYTIPYTKGEKIRDHLLTVSFFGPIVAAVPAIFLLAWESKYDMAAGLEPVGVSSIMTLMAMFPFLVFYLLINYPSLHNCHPEYNNWKFYWQYIAELNFFPIIAAILALAYLLG